MISGQLAPSSANFVQQSNYFIADEISTTTTTPDGLYKVDKTNTKFFSSNSSPTSSVSNNFDETTSLSTATTTTTTTTTTTKTTTNNKKQESTKFISNPSTNISISDIYNISSNNCNFISNSIGYSSNTTTPFTTTTTNSNTNTIHNTTLYNQQSSQLPSSATTITNPETTASAITTTATAASTNFNAATIAATNAITDARGRSAALERAYVHDVYENCEEPTSGPIRPRVAQFLANLEPGSIVCDVGCGNGRYLQSCNPLIYTIGVDRCYRLAKIAHEKGGEVALCDNLELPFRDESFDAVLSLAVVHHFATTERRVGAIRELARILRIGGRVIISVWALEQRHRRFESQDVLIPWQPPKNRNYNLSDDEDDDDYLPPYHAYTEDSTNSSRSAGDGDSSSLSSSSPGESCYSFVRRAIQKLAGGRKHPWFLDSWNSKDTKNDSSLEYEDAKDLPIELRRLEDFEDLPDPPLSAGLKSRSLGSILNPPPIVQIVRSRSSVPSLGAQIPEHKFQQQQQQQIYLPPNGSGSTTSLDIYNATISSTYTNTSPSRTSIAQYQQKQESFNSNEIITNISPTKQIYTSTQSIGSIGSNGSVSGGGGRRPKLVKQKQSLCDEEYQLPDNHVHMMSTDSNYVSNYNNSYYSMNKVSGISSSSYQTHNNGMKSTIESRMFLRKQSSLNEELMAENRLREKERIRKRIQKQMSLNETFLCRSLFTKRLQIIREGFTTKLKTSTGSLERVTKNGFVKIMQNFKASQFSTSSSATTTQHNSASSTNTATNCHHHHHHHKNNGNHHQQNHCGYSRRMSSGGSNKNCAECNCGNSTITNNCNQNSNCNGTCSSNNSNNDNEDQKPRRHSRESGSDSSKDSSLQSDTSIESEDSFASVIFIPKPEQQQKQSNHQQQHNSNSNNNSNIYNNCNSNGNNCISSSYKNTNSSFNNKIPSVPTSPLVMPCPPTPAHSPAAITTTTSSSSSSAPTSATGYNFLHRLSNSAKVSSSNSNSLQGKNNNNNTQDQNNTETRDRFTFDEEHIIQQQKQQQQQQQKNKTSPTASRKTTTSSQEMSQLSQQQQLPKLQKITRQQIQNLPQIPKFRKQQSLQITKASFPIVRRASAAPAVPKLLSLEIFNPETDDLDSDSSEPSSPDSIDSVISALKPDADEITITKQQTNKRPEMPKKCFSVDSSVLSSSLSKSRSNSIENQQGSTNPFIDTFDAEQILKSKDIEGPLVLNKEVDDSSTNLIYNVAKRNQEFHQKQQKQQNVVDFAEQLSAQLLKKLEENNKNLESPNFHDKNFVNNKNSIIRENCRKSNSDLSDLNALKEELRERRLMLANLSTQSSFQHQQQQQQQQSPTSSSSTTSSQTRSCSIYDDTNNELRYSPSLFDSKAAKRKFLRNFNENRQHSSGSSSILDTAYLIPDTGGDSSFDDDDDDDNGAILGDEHDIADIDEVDHDVIIEEDEDDVDDDDDDNSNCGYNSMKSNTIKYLDNDKVITTTKILGNNQIKKDDSGDGDIDEDDDDDDDEDDNNNGNNYDQNNDKQKILKQQQQQRNQEQNQETWGHSNSTNSLDSPSQGGGSTTHHRYYHVFREGELDALINHHVASLHIVSSYYERASWCVVAEKVQVWTI